MVMTLPTLYGQTTAIPHDAVCPWCKKNKVLEPHSMAILIGGALLMDRSNDSGRMSDDLDGFLTLTWHGAHEKGEGKDREIYASVDLAENTRGGQFEVYFCSTDCLRSYLNFCVDELEKKIEGNRSNHSEGGGV